MLKTINKNHLLGVVKMENKKDILDCIKQEINLSKKEFSKYQEYLSEEFYQNVVDELINNLEDGKTMSITIANLTRKELSRIVNEGNVDLEIKLVNDYRSKTQFLMRKLNIPNTIIKKIEEDVLIDAIENYDASSTFHVYILRCIKNQVEALKHKEKKEIQNKEDKQKRQSLSFGEKLNEYINKNGIKKRDPLYLEKAFKIVKPFMDEIEEPQFNKFIYLRYGYHDDIYFSLDDISNILNIDQEKAANYYDMSLSLLKKGTDAFINQYIKQEISKIKKIEN